MNSIAIIGIIVSVLVGLAMYAKFQAGSQALAGIYGVLRNILLFIVGAAIMLGWGSLGVLIGGLIIVFAVYLGAGHYDNATGNDTATTIEDKLYPD